MPADTTYLWQEFLVRDDDRIRLEIPNSRRHFETPRMVFGHGPTVMALTPDAARDLAAALIHAADTSDLDGEG